MIRDAVRSLKKDLDRAVFYWIVFVLSSMFLFLFFHLSLSEAVGFTFIYSKNDLPTYLTVFDVLVTTSRVTSEDFKLSSPSYLFQ